MQYYYDDIKLTLKQKDIINCFKDRDLVSRKELLSISSGALNTLISKNILIKEEVEHYRLNYSLGGSDKKILTTDQKKSLMRLLIVREKFIYYMELLVVVKLRCIWK